MCVYYGCTIVLAVTIKFFKNLKLDYLRNMICSVEVVDQVNVTAEIEFW